MKHAGSSFFLGLDIEILEPDPINRKKGLFCMMKKDIHLVFIIILAILGNPVGSCLGLVKYNRSSGKPVFHGKLIVWVNMDYNPIVGKIRNR